MIKFRTDDKKWYELVKDFCKGSVFTEIDKTLWYENYSYGIYIEFYFHTLYMWLKDKVTFTYNPEMGTEFTKFTSIQI